MADTVMLLITSDFHWNMKDRDKYRHDFVDAIAAEIKGNDKINGLLLLGDLCDEKDRHCAELVNKVVGHIYRLSQLCKVHVLKGNHDYLSPSTPFFGFLTLLDNVHWFNDPEGSDENLGDDILMLPHTYNHEKDWMDVNIKKYSMVFTHNCFEGAVSEHGRELKGIPLSVFSKKQVVISGDVHPPQKLGAVEYVGAPYPINFGDDYHPHMIILSSKGVRKYVSYTGPRKLVFDVPHNWDLDLEGDAKEGDILKIRVHLDVGQGVNEFRRIKDEILRGLEGSGCIIYQVQPVLEFQGSTRTAVSNEPSRRSDLQVLKSYASSAGATKSIVKTGVRLMRKV